eukprot:3816662-Pyramimonas_sp.AAC.2
MIQFFGARVGTSPPRSVIHVGKEPSQGTPARSLPASAFTQSLDNEVDVALGRTPSRSWWTSENALSS